MDPKPEFLVDGKYSFKELVNIDQLRQMFESFSQSTGFTTGLVSFPDQELLISTGWRDICTQFHRAFPASAVHCTQSNIDLTQRLKERKELIGIGSPIAEAPSHTTVYTDHVYGGSAVRKQ